jgi:hypothetical protein
MRKILIMCTVAVTIFAATAIASRCAEAGSPVVASTAIHRTDRAQYVGDAHYRQCGYYRYVCRAWWAGCGWEGPYYFPLYRYWGLRYLCM